MNMGVCFLNVFCKWVTRDKVVVVVVVVVVAVVLVVVVVAVAVVVVVKIALRHFSAQMVI